MRAIWYGSMVVGLFLFAVPARADEQAEGKALLEKAVKALGAEVKLGKLTAGTFKGKLTANGPDSKEMTANVEGSWQGLDQFRIEAEVNEGAVQKGVIVVNRDKAWFSGGGRIEEAPKEVLDLLLPDLYALKLASTPLLVDKESKLSPLGEVKVGGRATWGLKVSCKGRADVDLYLDQENGLPLKCEVRVTEPGGNDEVAHEFLFGDYKEVDGVKHFTKLTLNRKGTKTFELELSEVKREQKLEDTLFAKPE
jgi:hypothetical protein